MLFSTRLQPSTGSQRAPTRKPLYGKHTQYCSGLQDEVQQDIECCAQKTNAAKPCGLGHRGFERQHGGYIRTSSQSSHGRKRKQQSSVRQPRSGVFCVVLVPRHRSELAFSLGLLNSACAQNHACPKCRWHGTKSRNNGENGKTSEADAENSQKPQHNCAGNRLFSPRHRRSSVYSRQQKGKLCHAFVTGFSCCVTVFATLSDSVLASGACHLISGSPVRHVGAHQRLTTHCWRATASPHCIRRLHMPCPVVPLRRDFPTYLSYQTSFLHTGFLSSHLKAKVVNFLSPRHI